jgi:hypothetical protein
MRLETRDGVCVVVETEAELREALRTACNYRAPLWARSCCGF